MSLKFITDATGRSREPRSGQGKAEAVFCHSKHTKLHRRIGGGGVLVNPGIEGLPFLADKRPVIYLFISETFVLYLYVHL